MYPKDKLYDQHMTIVGLFSQLEQSKKSISKKIVFTFLTSELETPNFPFEEYREKNAFHLY